MGTMKQNKLSLKWLGLFIILILTFSLVLILNSCNNKESTNNSIENKLENYCIEDITSNSEYRKVLKTKLIKNNTNERTTYTYFLLVTNTYRDDFYTIQYTLAIDDDGEIIVINHRDFNCIF